MESFAELQSQMAGAVLDQSAGVPAAIRGAARGEAERRFSVYRNNLAAGLVSALAARFPVVQRLVGPAFFSAMASIYIKEEPPRTPVLLEYGSGFAGFIDGFVPASTVPYLGDVARLEFARGRAYHAADREPLAARAFAELDPDAIADAGVVLHPSLGIVASCYPVVSIWEAHRDADAMLPVQCWKPEAALIARPGRDVQVVRLPCGGAEFIGSLSRRMTIGQAAEAAHRAVGDGFDLVASMAVLAGARIVTALCRATSAPSGSARDGDGGEGSAAR